MLRAKRHIAGRYAIEGGLLFFLPFFAYNLKLAIDDINKRAEECGPPLIATLKERAKPPSVPSLPNWPSVASQNTSRAKTKMDLLLKDSPLLSQSTGKRIRADLTGLRDYFSSLHIEAPAESSAIGVEAGRTGVIYVGPSESFALAQNSSIPPTTIPTPVLPLPGYRQNIMIGEKSLDERTVITLAYSSHVLGGLLKNRRLQHPSVSTLQDMMATSCLSTYFNWSFWDSKPEKEGEYWAAQLWQIRQKLGKDFTDKLLSFTFRAITDTPEENASPDFDIYFYNKLKNADSVIDNDLSKISIIADTLERSGISFRKPKAVLTFDTSVAWKGGGVLSIIINVANETDVDAKRGQLRTDFQTDPEIVMAPEGSLNDPSTTLKSARIIPFDAIPAHSKREFRFDIIPVPLHVDPMLLININYECETCVKDCYSHAKQFDLSKASKEAHI